MESPIANLFLAIQDRILDQVPEIKYIDQNMGQYLNNEFRNQMLFPALLVDFPTEDFSELQGLNQFVDVNIMVTLFYEVWDHTNSLTPMEIKEAGLKYLEIDQKVFMALQGWHPDFCEPLIRRQSKNHNANETGLRVKEISFSTQYEDYSCDDDSAKVQFTLRTE